MSAAFYNEIDQYCCAWMSNLMDAGLITPGVICDKSIEDLLPDELMGYRRVHMFAGIGVWDFALNCAGWGNAEVWTGSCPCQPFSAAGKGAGFDDERHLWPAFHWLIEQRRPSVILGEQVASKDGLQWFDAVRSDLEATGYAAGGADLCAAGVGAPHIRQRLYWAAYSERDKQSRKESCSRAVGRMGRVEQSIPWDRDWKVALAGFRAMGDGAARCVEATDAARNAIVPQVAQAWIETVMECLP